MASMKRIITFFTIILLLMVTAAAFGLTVNYQYDDLHRLTRVERSDGITVVYTYDDVGNRTSRTLSSSGTITIDPDPNSINASWTLTGPNNYIQTGIGDTTYTGLMAGDYTVQWGNINCYTKPDTVMKALPVGGNISFQGTYIPVILPAPANVQATDGTLNPIRVTWQAVTGATNYMVYRNTTNNTVGAQWLATLLAGAQQPQYNDINALINTIYYYWIKATNGACSSGFSNADSGYFGTVTPTPQIQVTPTVLDFGSVPKGTGKQLTVTVKNTGSGLLTGNASTTAPFSIISAENYNLSTDQSQVITIQYLPTSKGPHTGAVVFAGGNGATVPVTGKTEESFGLPWLILLLGD